MKETKYYCPNCEFSSSSYSEVEDHLFLKHNLRNIQVSTHPPSFPMENNNSLCDTYTKWGNKGQGVTKQQLEAYNLRYENGKKVRTYTQIAKIMGISAKNVHKHVKNFTRKCRGVKKNAVGVINHKGKNPHKIRLHADCVSIKIKTDLKKVKGKTVHLKYVDYKQFDDNEYRIQVFPKKTVITFKTDIIADTEEQAKITADKRIKDYLIENYGVGEYTLLKRHYGILGTDLAKTVRDNKMIVVLYDHHDGKVRQRIDFSHEKPEIDSEHVEKGFSDSSTTNAYLYDIIENRHYLPSQTKSIIDTILTVQNEYAFQIRKHLEVQSETLKTLKKIQEALEK